MEPLITLLVLGWLLVAPVLAGAYAGSPRRGWVAIWALILVIGPALVLTAYYGWPFGPCYTDGGCWEFLILAPFYLSSLLAIMIFTVVLLVRRRGAARRSVPPVAAADPATLAGDDSPTPTQIKELDDGDPR